MSQEVSASLEEKSRRETIEMCMKQMKDLMDAVNEANTVITERYVQLLPSVREEEGDTTVNDLDTELRKLYVVTHRAQQLECMMKSAFEKENE